MAKRRVGRAAHRPSHRRVFVLVAALLLTATTPVIAQDGATYGARPAPGEGDRSAGTFHLSIGTGSAVSDGVEILNFTNEPATFDVYAADVVTASGGGLAPAARDAKITGPGAWVAVDRPTVEVPGRSSTIVAFSVRVPAGTPLGDHVVAILVEPRRSGDTDAIASTTRVGLWIKVRVLGSAVLGETGIPWALPWIVAIFLGLAIAGWLAYVTRDRWRRWLRERREERDLVRDFRSRRRHDGTTGGR